MQRANHFSNVEWLSALCCDNTQDPDKSPLAGELCKLAVHRFCQQHPSREWGDHSDYIDWERGRESSLTEKALLLLLKALVAAGRDAELARVLKFVSESPDEFRLDTCQVPCLKAIVPWSQERPGALHPQLAEWLATARGRLERPPRAGPKRPPTRGARPTSRASAGFAPRSTPFWPIRRAWLRASPRLSSIVST